MDCVTNTSMGMVLLSVSVNTTLSRCRIALIAGLNVVDNKMNVCASCTCKHVLVSYTYCKYMKYSENNSLLVTRRVTLLV